MEPEEQTSFGVFKPVGHTVISFPGADQEMLAQAERDIQSASPLASMGQELNLVLAHKALAEQGYHWLVVHTPDDALAQQVAACVQPLGAERAQRYGHCIIGELITHADAPPQVAESPDRQLDAGTPSGREQERAVLRPGVHMFGVQRPGAVEEVGQHRDAGAGAHQ